MSNSAITTQLAQLKVGNVQNQADTSAVYSAGQWSFKNSTALTSVTITDAGNVGIGTESPINLAGYKSLTISSSTGGWLEVTNGTVRGIIQNGSNDFTIETRSNHPIIFNTNNAERMRIDASGNLLVGTTDTAFNSGSGFKINVSGVSTGVVGQVVASSSNGDITYRLYSTGAGAYRFYVGMGGTVYATSTTITGISDERLKENIRDLDEGLNTVLALKPRKFDWKEGKGANIKNARGFIAQEFEQVLPDMIEEWKDPAPEGEEPYKAVNANLIPTLVKAIQELSAKVDAQAAEIEALKAKP